MPEGILQRSGGSPGGRATRSLRSLVLVLAGGHPASIRTEGNVIPEHLNDVGQACLDGMGRTRVELEALVRIPSISFDGFDPDEVRRSADAVAALLADAGFDEVRLLEVDGAHPYVTGTVRAEDPEAPTVLLYAHHDVQPVGTPDNWTSPPFEPTERDGRLFGRGTADDKAGILVHVAAVRAWLETRGTVPVTVKVVIEGEEEIGSPHLPDFLARYADELRSDVIVLTDLPNWKVGWPALTTALRGMGELHVTLDALRQPVHSGMWGGPFPDAVTGMVRLLATLHDEDGAITVAGFDDDVRVPSEAERSRLAALDPDLDELRDEAGVLDGVEVVGDRDATVLERLWFRPTITPIGMDLPSVRDASNQLVNRVRAKLSVRFAPGQDPDRCLGVLEEHLRAHVPFGMRLSLERGASNAAWSTDPEGPAFAAADAAMSAAYDHPVAHIGCGGSIPFVQPFSDAFGGAPCLLTGIEDPSTNAHGEDESLHLGDFAKACLAETLLLQELADRL